MHILTESLCSFRSPHLRKSKPGKPWLTGFELSGTTLLLLVTLAIHSRSFRRPQSTEEAFAGPSNPDSPQRQPLTPTLTVWGSVITAPLIELTSRIIWGHLNQVTYQHPPAYNMFGENSPNPTL